MKSLGVGIMARDGCQTRTLELTELAHTGKSGGNPNRPVHIAAVAGIWSRGCDGAASTTGRSESFLAPTFN